MIVLFIGALVYSLNSQIPQTVAQTTPVAPELRPSDIDVYELYNLTNQDRQQAGIAPLRLNPKLNASAKAKCDDMVAKNYWSHDAPDGTQPWQFFSAQGITGLLGENLAEGSSTSADRDNTDWMKSPGHKANILNPNFTDVGFAVCLSKSYAGNKNLPALITVQHFAQL